jgi:hypothetical protein
MNKKIWIILLVVILVLTGITILILAIRGKKDDEISNDFTGVSGDFIFDGDDEYIDTWNEEYSTPITRMSGDKVCLCENTSTGKIYNQVKGCNRGDKNLGCVYENKM